jgi:signal transduction histidine kinase
MKRAIILYIGTIVVPACVLLWLGIQSFQRQRQVVETLTAEKLAADLDARTRNAAEAALADHNHPAGRFYFEIENGKVIRPAISASLPESLPSEFVEADRQESERPDVALVSYQRILSSGERRSLALAGIARCLSRIPGREQESRATWRKLAADFPDDRDLSHRPYGIVAAMNAGDTEGLFDRIASGRWELDKGQARYFLTQLDPLRSSPYLEQFTFAEALDEHFKAPGTLGENEIYPFTFPGYRIFYRSDGPDRIAGLAVNEDWVGQTLRPQLEGELKIGDTTKQSLYIYGGATALVLVILSSGILLLLRDMSRESRTNRLRSDFVSSVSHELKTPITLVRLYSETLLRHEGLGNQERGEFYRIIMRESERLGRLVSQILTFSRVERGDQIYKLEAGDLVPAIAGIVDDYHEFLEHAGFSIERVLPDSVPPVRFDSAALSQAVINLLDNAAKYSGDSRNIAVRLNVEDRNVALEVEDQGVGIPKSEQEKIFERFYRIANGSGKGGYGLGLFMVRHIMQAHGGRAEVDSEPGRGSRFRLVFPVVNEWPNNASS